MLKNRVAERGGVSASVMESEDSGRGWAGKGVVLNSELELVKIQELGLEELVKVTCQPAGLRKEAEGLTRVQTPRSSAGCREAHVKQIS